MIRTVLFSSKFKAPKERYMLAMGEAHRKITTNSKAQLPIKFVSFALYFKLNLFNKMCEFSKLVGSWAQYFRARNQI